ncbi:NPD-domain-containing protein [Hesseltinella vesiculosa]|uniref:NPD-domain-containing protein n=1 Tax=Hesseltinella vesiculosa TaxID=101127 RepID=A0A1X2GAX3_9FUNG|nr:NPD-domain-containing protein [Hesseltinella vesiculosa]
MLAPDALRRAIREMKSLTSQPFAVNLFCRMQPPPTQEQLDQTYPSDQLLAAVRSKLGLHAPEKVTLRSPPLQDQVQVILEEGVPVVSFTFGYLPDEMVRSLKAKGIYLMGTATTVAEALVLAGDSPEERKVDCVIAQGLEAGGHRGSFLPTTTTDPQGDLHQRQQPALALAQSLRQALQHRKDIAIVAAGGISNGQDAARYLVDQPPVADGVVMGTLFMLSSASSTPPAHREALLNDTQHTQLSNRMTGRFARGIPNALMKTMEEADTVPSYDIHSAKTKDIVTYATEHSNADYMLLLTGERHLEAAKYTERGTMSPGDIVNKLVKDITALQA